MIPRICELAACSRSFEAREIDVKRGMNRYCSIECSHLARKEQTKTPKPNTVCTWCGAGLYRAPAKLAKSKTFYCDQSHQAKAIAAGTLKTGPARSGRGECSCGKRYKGKFGMCRECHSLAVIKIWLAGNQTVTWTGRGDDPKQFVKAYLVEQRGDRCEICGFDERAPDGRSIIQMDHIDGNHRNNAPDNLKLLCPNHHAMTPTFGSRNKNATRAYRRSFEYVEKEATAPTL